MKNKIKQIIEENIRLKKSLLNGKHIEQIKKAADYAIFSLKNKGKVIVFGNGGSAADAQHMVAELIGRFKKERKALPAVSLATNTSTLTALSNDYSYGVSFARQLEALAGANDIAIGISTSGNAANVINAIKKAKELKLRTIGLSGKSGGELCKHTDASIIIPSDDTARIQEAHILIIHILCELIENETAA